MMNGGKGLPGYVARIHCVEKLFFSYDLFFLESTYYDDNAKSFDCEGG